MHGDGPDVPNIWSELSQQSQPLQVIRAHVQTGGKKEDGLERMECHISNACVTSGLGSAEGALRGLPRELVDKDSTTGRWRGERGTARDREGKRKTERRTCEAWRLNIMETGQVWVSAADGDEAAESLPLARMEPQAWVSQRIASSLSATARVPSA